jgi:adenylate cyclase
LAQRAIGSFARFVPKEIVRRVIHNSISTKLGGVKQEITLVFTDVEGFTTIAEAADPDVLMRQTSRYFSVLTEAFLAESGTVDKFIGDAVMVFWNAPNPQSDHVARLPRGACGQGGRGEAQCRIRGRRPEAVRHPVRHSCRRSPPSAMSDRASA